LNRVCRIAVSPKEVLDPDDEVIEHKEQTVLLIDHEVSTALAGKTIDVDEHPDGPRFVVRR
jgi:hypothetical protein